MTTDGQWTYDIECDDDVSTPDDMSGPFVGYSLVGKIGGWVPGEGKFETLSEAIDAGRLVDGCVGVTKGNYGYTLRTELILVPSRSDNVKSWVFGEMCGEEETGGQVNLVPMTREFITQSLGSATNEEEMTYYLKKLYQKGVGKNAMEELSGLEKELDELNQKKKELEERVQEIKNAEKLATTPTPEMLKKMNQRNKILQLAKKGQYIKMLALVKELQDNSTGVEVEESDSEDDAYATTTRFSPPAEEVDLEEWTHNEEEYLVDPRTGEVYNSDQEVMCQRVGTSFKIYAVGHRVSKDGRWTLERNE